MHESQSGHDGAGSDQRPGLTVQPAVHVPAAGSSGELTVLERLEAFRDLIRHGNALLGEVVTYCRNAEAAVTQLAAEKSDIDRRRLELERAQARAAAEAQAARDALAQVEAQRAELGAIRGELLKARTEMNSVQRVQDENASALERSLNESKQQQQQLEMELQRLRAQAVSARKLDERLSQVEQMEAKLRVTERELSETRRALENERSRRDRAIALIKPKSVTAEAHA